MDAIDYQNLERSHLPSLLSHPYHYHSCFLVVRDSTQKAANPTPTGKEKNHKVGCSAEIITTRFADVLVEWFVRDFAPLVFAECVLSGVSDSLSANPYSRRSGVQPYVMYRKPSSSLCSS